MRVPTRPPITLVEPTLEGLTAYANALAAGWSPDSERDASAERLTALLLDPAAFLRDITGREPTITLDDGSVVPRLPSRAYWIWDGEFSGTINLRWQPGSEELPGYVSGHVGYTVVPWKRRRGYATQALAMVLPVARTQGLERVLLTTDPDNLASRRVIEANGGVLSGTGPHPWASGKVKLLYWVPTGAETAARRGRPARAATLADRPRGVSRS
jgi:predicted acetyltransferase